VLAGLSRPLHVLSTTQEALATLCNTQELKHDCCSFL
jgi:hypothetical protein